MTHPTYPVDPELVRIALEKVIYRDARYTVTAGQLIEQMLAAGIGVYAGGGTPREWLCGERPRDLDVFVDRDLDAVHQLLRRAWPGIDPARRPRPHGYVLIWGDGGESEIEIAILRSWRDIRNHDAFTTRFPSRANLVENAQLMDFSINAFYYDFRERVALDPLCCGLGDLLGKILRLVTHPEALASIHSTTLRVAQFLCRGYTATAETMAYVELDADRDLLGMGRRLWSWIPAHVVGTGVDLDEFGRRLEPWLRSEEARSLFARVMADLRGGAAGPGLRTSG